MSEDVKYRTRFLTRPDLDTEDFKDYTGRIEIEREIRVESDAGRLWRVKEIQTGDSRETIVLEPIRPPG
jgi:hypothetical protein